MPSGNSWNVREFYPQISGPWKVAESVSFRWLKVLETTWCGPESTGIKICFTFDKKTLYISLVMHHAVKASATVACLNCKLCLYRRLVRVSRLCTLHSRLHLFLGFSVTSSSCLWSPYGIGQTIIFLPCGFFFFLLSFFPLLISAVADWMSAILPHMVWP